MKLAVDLTLTPAQLAEALCDLADDDMAQVFIEMARLMKEWPAGAAGRWLWARATGEHLRDCACSNDDARELVARHLPRDAAEGRALIDAMEIGEDMGGKAHRTIRIGDGLEVGLDVVTQKLAFLARSGAGKTYAAGVLVEQLIEAHAQVVVVDPVGVWWGLRLAADGKRPGLSIPVFGGQHGDIPLEVTAGGVVAELVASQGVSVVLDVSDFTKSETRRFVCDFATALYRAKKAARSPVMVVWEECQDFVPQHVAGDSARMVGAMESLIKKGRNYGVGTTLISQRPQAVNKDVLNQTEVLVVLQTTGPQERKAIEGWIVEQGLEEDVLDQLPGLAIGTAFVWSPQWLRLFMKVKIGKKQTYDASATPTFGQDETRRTIAPVDLEAVRKAMAASIEQAQANDPAHLKRRIADLEKAARAKSAAPPPAPPPAPKVVEVPVLKPSEIKRLEAVVDRAVAGIEKAGAAVAEMAKQLRAAAAPRPPAAPARPPVNVSVVPSGAYHVTRAASPAPRVARPPRAEGDITKGERVVLGALIQYPDGLRREQLTVLTGYKRSSRDTYLQKLREKGLADAADDRVFATADGQKALPDYEPLPVGEALRAYWLARLPQGERVILEHVMAVYPDAIERTQLDELTTYKRSSRDTYLQKLVAKELVEDAGRGAVRASGTLFA